MYLLKTLLAEDSEEVSAGEELKHQGDRKSKIASRKLWTQSV